jgi:hypothetical protein
MTSKLIIKKVLNETAAALSILERQERKPQPSTEQFIRASEVLTPAATHKMNSLIKQMRKRHRPQANFSYF